MQSKSFAFSLLMILSLVGCGDSGGPAFTTVASVPVQKPQPAPVGTKRTVALVMKTLTNPFFIEMEKGAHRAGKQLGIE